MTCDEERRSKRKMFGSTFLNKTSALNTSLFLDLISPLVSDMGGVSNGLKQSPNFGGNRILLGLRVAGVDVIELMGAFKN